MKARCAARMMQTRTSSNAATHLVRHSSDRKQLRGKHTFFHTSTSSQTRFWSSSNRNTRLKEGNTSTMAATGAVHLSRSFLSSAGSLKEKHMSTAAMQRAAANGHLILTAPNNTQHCTRQRAFINSVTRDRCHTRTSIRPLPPPKVHPSVTRV